MGLGRVIGGALQGYGAGVAEVARTEAAERRDIALTKLRGEEARATSDHQTKNAMIEDTHRGKIQNTNDAYAVNRRLNSNLVQADYEGQQAAASQKAKAQEAERERQHDLRMLVTKGNIERMNKKAEAEFSKNNVQSTFVSDTGERMIVTKGGDTIGTGVMATEKDRIHSPNSGGYGGVLAQTRGLGGPGQPAGATPTPTPSPTSTGAGQTYTQADAKHTAEIRGISVEEVHKRMRAAGYKLTN